MLNFSTIGQPSRESAWNLFLRIKAFYSIFLIKVCWAQSFQPSTNSKIIQLFFTLKTSHVAENGSTANPTKRSATAKLTKMKSTKMNKWRNFLISRWFLFLPMKKFVTLLSLCEQKTAAITKQFPTMTRILMKPKMAKEMRLLGSVHSTDSISWVHCDSFISFVDDA